MAIRVKCPAVMCGANWSVPDGVAGESIRCPKCGGVFVAAPPLDGKAGDTGRNRPSGTPEEPFPSLPAEFGRYRVLRRLGRGGMGAVYLADDTQLGRKVAMKLPFLDGDGTTKIERFTREARSAAGLQHPNICTLFDAGAIDGRPFLTMAYVEGRPLDEVIGESGPMPPRRAAEIVRTVARALAYAHASGVVHRDLKPANLMMRADGEPVVMDFGLAKLAGDADAAKLELTRRGGLVGTPSYMSPEQVRGDVAAIGPASDVYSLGAVLFELLTGQPPYVGSMTVVLGQILNAPIPPVTELRKDVPLQLEAICQQTLAKEVPSRLTGMAEFARALNAFLEPTPSIPDHAPPVEVELMEPMPPKEASLGPLAVTAPPPGVESVGEFRWRRPALMAVPLMTLLVVWAMWSLFRSRGPNGSVAAKGDGIEAKVTEVEEGLPAKNTRSIPRTQPAAPAPTKPSTTPTQPKAAGGVYASFRLTPGKVSSLGPTIGDQVRFQFGLKNVSTNDVAATFETTSDRRPGFGHIQYWIERLGSNAQIPTLTNRQGRRYPMSGWAIHTQANRQVVKAGDTYSIDERVLKTDNFPAGRYRIYADYKNAQRETLETQSVEFDLKPAP